MKKKYPSLVRILVVLAMVASLVGVMASPASAQQLTLDKANYSIGQSATVRVGSEGANKDITAIDTIEVTLASAPTGGAATLTLQETGVNTSTFEGTVTFKAAAVDNDGTDFTVDLAAALRDTVTVTYLWATTTATIVAVDIEKAAYKIGDSVTITVSEKDKSPAVADTITVTVKNDTTAHEISVVLTETGAATGTYRGSVTLVSEDVTSVAPGEVKVDKDAASIITATYGKATDTAAVDPVKPTSRITSHAQGAYVKSRTVTLQGNAADANSGLVQIEVSVDGGLNWATVFLTSTPVFVVDPWVYYWTFATDGKKSILTRARDAVSNVEAKVAAAASNTNWVEITVDSSLPEVTATSAVRVEANTTAEANKVVPGGALTLNATASDALSGIALVVADLNNDGVFDEVNELLTAGATVDALGNGPYSRAFTASTTAGSYTRGVKAKDQAGNYSTVATISYTVVADTTAPTFTSTTVSYVAGIQALRGEAVIISAKATDDLAGVDWVAISKAQAEVLFAAVPVADVDTDGDGVNDAVKLTYNAVTKAWAIALVVKADAAYQTHSVTLTAKDKASAANYAGTTVSVDVASARTTMAIPLAVGKNLVSVPMALASSNIWEAFEPIKTKVTKVYSYESGVPFAAWPDTIKTGDLAGTYLWRGDLMKIKPGMGYIIDMKEAATLIVTFAAIDPTTPPSTVSLGAGWSLVGYATRTLTTPVASASTYLSSLAGKWSVLYNLAWAQARPTILGAVAVGGFPTVTAGDASAYPWLTVGDPKIELGKGYWINLTAAGELVP